MVRPNPEDGAIPGEDTTEPQGPHTSLGLRRTSVLGYLRRLGGQELVVPSPLTEVVKRGSSTGVSGRSCVAVSASGRVSAGAGVTAAAVSTGLVASAGFADAFAGA